MIRIARALVVILASLLASHVAAQDAPRAPAEVRVVPPACVLSSIDVGEAVRLLQIELVGDAVGTVGVVSGPADEPEEEGSGRIAVITFRVEPCRADATTIDVVIDDAVTRKRVQRMVDIGGVATSVRPRALALGVAELLRASWAELARADAPEPAVALSEDVRRWITTQAGAAPAGSAAPERAPDSPVSLAAPVERPPLPSVAHPTATWMAGLTATLCAFPADGSALIGAHAHVSLSLDPDGPFRLRFDVGYAQGRVRVALGDVSARLLTGSLSLDVSSAGSAPLAVELGPRLSVGAGWLSGTPTDPTDAGTGGPGVVVFLTGHSALSAVVQDSWRLVLELELGYTLRGLDALADDRVVSGLSGPVIAMQLGARTAL